MTIVLIAFFLLLLVGTPIGIVLGIAGLVGIMQLGGEKFLAMAPARFFAGLDLFPFLAMPFFILAGEIMNKSGITNRLVGLSNVLVGWLRGGMAHSNMVASVFLPESQVLPQLILQHLETLLFPQWLNRAIRNLLLVQ